MPAVPPASLYLGEPAEATHCAVFVLYAARPPPPGALEDADLTDEDDLYDWYGTRTGPDALARWSLMAKKDAPPEAVPSL